jgi:hypothetical protein
MVMVLVQLGGMVDVALLLFIDKTFYLEGRCTIDTKEVFSVSVVEFVF